MTSRAHTCLAPAIFSVLFQTSLSLTFSIPTHEISSFTSNTLVLPETTAFSFVVPFCCLVCSLPKQGSHIHHSGGFWLNIISSEKSSLTILSKIALLALHHSPSVYYILFFSSEHFLKLHYLIVF